MDNMVKAAEGYLEDVEKLITDCLDKYMPSEASTPVSLHSAMRYAIFAGGKRLRPGLV